MGGLVCPLGHWCPQLHGLTFPSPEDRGAGATQTPGCNRPWTTPDAPRAAALPSQGGIKQGWRLVWCHERCHKEENEERRLGLSQSLRAAGGALICLKKASKFAILLQRPVLPAYVLVTDWREAQPCAEQLSQGLKNGTVPSDRMPLGIVVLCPNSKQYNRAAAWAKRLSTSLGLVLAVDIHRVPPASLGEPLRSLIHNNFANLSAGTQAAAEGMPSAHQQPQQQLQQRQWQQRQQRHQQQQQQQQLLLQQQQQQLQSQGVGPCLKGFEGGETPPTADSDNMASEGEEDFLETFVRIEETNYYATFDGAECHEDLQGLPHAGAVDWVADGPDARLTAMRRRYGTVGGETMPIERIYADMHRIRL